MPTENSATTVMDEDSAYWSKEARLDLGPSGLEELRKLRRWLLEEQPPRNAQAEWKTWWWSLHGKQPEGISFRPAPSLIVRSELEVYGNAMPRFALRAYLEGANGSFVNTRRIATVCAQMLDWGKRIPRNRRLPTVDENPPSWAPARTIRTASCIADALLVAPSAIRDKYHVLREAKLGLAYGEGQEIPATPYVKHVRLAGGGLCAQAVCFMAAALLSEREDKVHVHGIAEVTALASADNVDELNLRGLTYSEISRYFKREEVGLNAIRQIAIAPSGGDRFLRSIYESALRSYLLSQIPIVQSVDLGRMAGHVSSACPIVNPSIFSRNGVTPTAKPRLRRTESRHAVLLVGCHRDLPDEFLLNDPATYPFLCASGAQLLEAAIYTDSEKTDLVKNVFIPITPSGVRMPLCNWFDGQSDETGEKSAFFGLLQYAWYLQGRVPRPGFPPLRSPYTPSEFRLAKLDELTGLDFWPAGSLPTLETTISALKENGAGGGHWVWAQVLDRPDAIWLWDAELELPNERTIGNIRSEMVLAILELTKEGWRCTQLTEVAIPKQSEPIRRFPSDGKISPSLISSFEPIGLQAALRHWPRSADCWPPGAPFTCDLYAFLQGEAESLLPQKRLRQGATGYYWRARVQNLIRLLPIKLSGDIRWNTLYKEWKQRREPTFFEKIVAMLKELWPYFYVEWQATRGLGVRPPVCTVLERLQLLVDQPEEISQVARDIDNWISAILPELKVVALASFLQEIASSERKKYKPAQDALRAMVQIARALRAHNPERFPIHTIEMVAGSLIDGIWRGHDRKTSSEVFVANRRPVEQAQDQLLENLLPIMKEAQSAEIRLAFELEPGPLYILRDWASIKRFCERLDSSDYCDYSTATGINLDIVHWILAGIAPEQVYDNLAVYRRIAHGHVGGFGKGHFGDVAIGTLGNTEMIESWVDILRLRSQSNEIFPFSMYLAVEYEAAMHPSMVADSLKRLVPLL